MHIKQCIGKHHQINQILLMTSLLFCVILLNAQTDTTSAILTSTNNCGRACGVLGVQGKICVTEMH